MVKVNRLRGLITERQLTIRKVAKQMGISTNTLSRKLNGKAEFGTKEAEKLISILKIENPSEIFFAEENT